MGLSASMWTSVSGLLAHGNKMNVVGNNIANVSTIGFKSQRMDFNDYLYISGGSTSGTVQIGAGVATYAVIGDFSQGSLESTNSVTDLAIDGEGFFKVRQPNSDQMYYTRAGDFYFNANRQLQNPEGYYLQGWKIDNSTRLTFKNDSVNLGENSANESAFQGTGTPVDIVLDSWYLEPERTSSISFTMGLTSDGKSDRSTSATNPMTALFDQWDATKNPPMADSSYATSSSIKVYDEGGTAHTLTVYYDQVATNSNSYTIEGLPAGYTMYEYVVTIPPEEDMRSYGGKGYDPETNTWSTDPTNFYNPDPDICNKNAGMLMTGHLIFDTAGNLVNQTAYTYGGNTTDMGDNNQYSGDPADLASWQTTRFSSNGLPVFTANFTGQPLANTVNETTLNGKSQAQDFIIELDLGLRNLGSKNGDWSVEGGQSLADIKTTTTQTQETVYKSAPISSYLYADRQATAKNAYYYQDAAGKYYPVTVETDATANPAKQTITYTDKNGDTQNVDPSTARLYTKSMVEGSTKNLADVVDENFVPDSESEYYILQLRDANGDPLQTPQEVKVIIQPGADGNKIYPVDKDGNIGAEITQDKFSGTSPMYEGKFHQLKPKYTYTQGEPQIDTSIQGDVVYRDANGAWANAYDANGLKADAQGQALYIPTVELVTKSSINYNDVATFAEAERGENSTKAGSASFVTQDASQNGYPSGILSGTNITSDGVVYGYYDNGETVPLYQIALYDFHNKQGLRREGGNLYGQTKESGEARQGVAGEAGFGVTRAYNIEGSNVDMSREFVNMITTQRGFQANSKGITTVDTMLETVIGMKR